MQFLYILFLIASVVHSFEVTTEKPTDIFIKGDAGKYKLGTLKYEESWSLEENKIEFPSGTYCVGVDGHECFNYINVDYPVHKTVLIRTNNRTINSIALLESEEEGLQLQQREIRKGAAPQLKTHNGLAKETELVEPVVLEKSFIQKYWMYIVPPLVIFLLLSGDQK